MTRLSYLLQRTEGDTFIILATIVVSELTLPFECAVSTASHCRFFFFFFSSRRRHTRLQGDWSSDVCFPICFGTKRDAAESAEDLFVARAVIVLDDFFERGVSTGEVGGPCAKQLLELVEFGSLSPRSQLMLRSEEHTSELQSPCNLVCRLLLE